MKTLLTLLTLGCLLMLASCTTTEDPAAQIRAMDSGNRDAEQMRFADEIIAKAGIREVDDSGTVYPGTVKVIRWEYQGQKKYTALRLATWPHVHDALPCWQGPNPSSGFYGSKLTTEILN